MALFLEDSDKVTKRKAPIPKKDAEYYSALYNALEPVVGKNNLKNLKSLGTKKEYNKKGADQKNGKDNNVKYVNVDVAKKRMQRMNPDDIAQGGQKAYNFYKKTVERARSQEKVEPVQPPKPTSNASLKPEVTKEKKIETPNGTIKYTVTAENRVINEDDGWHVMHDYLSKYGVWYVLDQFFKNPKGRQSWTPLINPYMYYKALSEFTKYGKLINFPTEYVYQWMGIIMRNTAILETCTELAGHTQCFPGYEVSEYAESRGYEICDSFEEGSEWLDEIGFYDWNLMPDGSDAISDFGLDPIEKVISEYNENLPPEKVLVLVNRILDIYHCRGDLSSIFITGGRSSLNRIARIAEERKIRKIYLPESKIMKLR